MPDPPHTLTQGHLRPSANHARLQSSRGLLAVAGLVTALVLIVTGVLVVRSIWPVSPTPAASAPPPPQDRYGAPIPTAPRDVRPLEENVCGALDPSQWKALNIEPSGRPGTAITGWPTCDWKGVSDPRLVRVLGAAEAETSEHVSISATTTNDDLVGVYHSHMFDITQATSIGGLRPWWDRTR